MNISVAIASYWIRLPEKIPVKVIGHYLFFTLWLLEIPWLIICFTVKSSLDHVVCLILYLCHKIRSWRPWYRNLRITQTYLLVSYTSYVCLLKFDSDELLIWLINFFQLELIIKGEFLFFWKEYLLITILTCKRH